MLKFRIFLFSLAGALLVLNVWTHVVDIAEVTVVARQNDTLVHQNNTEKILAEPVSTENFQERYQEAFLINDRLERYQAVSTILEEELQADANMCYEKAKAIYKEISGTTKYVGGIFGGTLANLTEAEIAEYEKEKEMDRKIRMEVWGGFFAKAKPIAMKITDTEDPRSALESLSLNPGVIYKLLLQAMGEERNKDIVKGTSLEMPYWTVTTGNEWQGFNSSAWLAMVSFSFGDERAKDFLLDDFLNSESFFSLYYLSLFPNSEDFNQKVFSMLDEEQERLKKEMKEESSHLFDEHGNIATHGQVSENWEKAGKRSVDLRAYLQSPEFVRFFRLAELKRTLDFNRRIPEHELERFTVVRRELGISFATLRLGTRAIPTAEVLLRRGEEHFSIYLLEYLYLSPHPVVSGIEGFQHHPWYDVEKNRHWLSIYERELSNPIYTERQRVHIQTLIKSVTDLLEREEARQTPKDPEEELRKMSTWELFNWRIKNMEPRKWIFTDFDGITVERTTKLWHITGDANGELIVLEPDADGGSYYALRENFSDEDQRFLESLFEPFSKERDLPDVANDEPEQ